MICKTKSLLVALTSDDIQAKLDKYPEIREHIHQKGAERLQDIENIKHKSDTKGEDKKLKPSFNVKKSSFRSSLDMLCSPSQATPGPALVTNPSPTMGLLTPDAMVMMKSRASSRRSSLNPETAMAIPDFLGHNSIMPGNEPAFIRRKSFNVEQDGDTNRLNKSSNGSRKMKLESGNSGNSVYNLPTSDICIAVPQIDVSFGSEFKMILTEDVIADDTQKDDMDLPAIMVETPSMINLAESKEDMITLPSIMIKTPSLIDLESLQTSKEQLETKEPEKIISSQEQFKSSENEPRRISVAVWSDPTLVNVMLKKENVSESQKQAKEWTSILPEETEVDEEDYDELSFLQTRVGDSNDQLVESISKKEEILMLLLNYLSMKEIFKIRSLCSNMYSIIPAVGPPQIRNINLTPYFRKLNDKGLIAIANLFGDFIEKINLHCAYQLTDRSIQKLAKLSPNLTYLNVSDVWEFSDTSLTALSSFCPNLVHVDLSNCRKISNKGLLNLLESCSNISVLSLSYCKNLTNKVLDHEGWTRIKSLNLHRCTGIGDRGFEYWPLFADDLDWANSCQFGTSGDWAMASDENIKTPKKMDNFDDLASLQDSSVEREQEFSNPTISNISNLTGNNYNPKISISLDKLSELGSTAFALRSLDLRDCSFLTDSAIASIASACAQLTMLNLSFCCSLSEDFGRYLGKT